MVRMPLKGEFSVGMHTNEEYDASPYPGSSFVCSDGVYQKYFVRSEGDVRHSLMENVLETLHSEIQNATNGDLNLNVQLKWDRVLDDAENLKSLTLTLSYEEIAPKQG